MRTPTIHVVTEFKRDTKIESYWYECFHDSDFHDFDVNIIDGTLLDHESYLYSDTFFKSTQLRVILDMMGRGKIKDGDVFVFTNAWNYVAIPLSYFRDEFQMNIHMIGVWGDSLYNHDSPMWHRFKLIRKDWGRQVELSLFNAYDMNCFWSQTHWEMFKGKFTSLKGDETDKWSGQVVSRYAITGYPFGYLAKEREVNKKEKKVPTIAFPYNLRFDAHSALISGLMADLKEYEIVLAQDIANNRLAYNDLLDDAKLMVSFNKTEINPVLLYEAMLCGVIPLVPDHLVYQELFDDAFRYPASLSIPKNGKILYLHRSRHQLERIIKDCIDNYDELLPKCVENAKYLGGFYSNEPFLKMLHEVMGRPPKRLYRDPVKVKKIKKRNLKQY